jgi:hypothetical protein
MSNCYVCKIKLRPDGIKSQTEKISGMCHQCVENETITKKNAMKKYCLNELNFSGLYHFTAIGGLNTKKGSELYIRKEIIEMVEKNPTEKYTKRKKKEDLTKEKQIKEQNQEEKEIIEREDNVRHYLKKLGYNDKKMSLFWGYTSGGINIGDYDNLDDYIIKCVKEDEKNQIKIENMRKNKEEKVIDCLKKLGYDEKEKTKFDDYFNQIWDMHPNLAELENWIKTIMEQDKMRKNIMLILENTKYSKKKDQYLGLFEGYIQYQHIDNAYKKNDSEFNLENYIEHVINKEKKAQEKRENTIIKYLEDLGHDKKKKEKKEFKEYIETGKKPIIYRPYSIIKFVKCIMK